MLLNVSIKRTNKFIKWSAGRIIYWKKNQALERERVPLFYFKSSFPLKRIVSNLQKKSFRSKRELGTNVLKDSFDILTPKRLLE